MSGRSLGAVCARSERGLGVVWGAIWAQSRLDLQIGRGLDWGLGRELGRGLGRLFGRLFGRELGRELCRELGQELGRELGWELGALGHAAPTWGIGAHCPDPNPSFFGEEPCRRQQDQPSINGTHASSRILRNATLPVHQQKSLGTRGVVQ